MARQPRIKTPPAPSLPEPRYCQYPAGCSTGGKPFASLTFESAAGLRWTESACQYDQERRADQIRAEGGELLLVRLVESADG